MKDFDKERFMIGVITITFAIGFLPIMIIYIPGQIGYDTKLMEEWKYLFILGCCVSASMFYLSMCIFLKNMQQISKTIQRVKVNILLMFRFIFRFINKIAKENNKIKECK